MSKKIANICTTVLMGFPPFKMETFPIMFEKVNLAGGFHFLRTSGRGGRTIHTYFDYLRIKFVDGD